MKNPWTPLARGIVVSFLICSGCVSLERSAPERHYFVIELPQGSESSSSANDKILSVGSLRISPRYADRSFVYRISDAGYETDYYNQFLTAPDVMITEELRKGLAGSKLFKYVLGPADPQQPDYVLEGSISSLYGDFRNASQPAAVLALEVFVYNENSGNSGIVMQKRYVKSVPLTAKTPEALVRGWNQALQQIAGELATDLNRANLNSRNLSPQISPDRDTTDAATSR